VIRVLMMATKPVARTGVVAMLRHRSGVIVGIMNKLIVFPFGLRPSDARPLMQRAVAG
jgi:hypothetical protein